MFHDYEQEDYARFGTTATYAVNLPAGPLLQFAHSIEPQLRKLGLPTKIEKGWHSFLFFAFYATHRTFRRCDALRQFQDLR